MNELDIFTDCAGSVDEFGIAFLIIENEAEKIYKSKINLKELNKEFSLKESSCSIAIGECYAIFMALKTIKNKYSKIRIYTDSFHTFLLLNRQKCKQKNDLIKILSSKCLEIMDSNNVEVMWIKGHIGIYGNEIVNRLAKKSLRKKRLCST